MVLTGGFKTQHKKAAFEKVNRINMYSDTGVYFSAGKSRALEIILSF